MKVQMENDSGSKRTDTTGRSHPHTLPAIPCTGALTKASIPTQGLTEVRSHGLVGCVRMILPQVHLRKPCYDSSFL